MQRVFALCNCQQLTRHFDQKASRFGCRFATLQQCNVSVSGVLNALPQGGRGGQILPTYLWVQLYE